MKKNHIKTGIDGENLAADYLIKENYTILERNWRFKHLEIDIIASRLNILIFIEVKSRKSLVFGYPEESIRKIKMKRLKQAAALYHYHHPEFKRIQFNVISILMQPDKPASLKMFEDVYF